MQKITRRTKNLGWGYSFTPTGKDAWSIKPPAAPDVTGTPRQVMEHINSDPVWNNRGGVAAHQAYFLGERRIVAVAYTRTEPYPSVRIETIGNMLRFLADGDEDELFVKLA